jgi:CubicO group peptidase (beta-lactamase class C family)
MTRFRPTLRFPSAFLAALLVALGAHAQDLPRARPEDVGLSSERLAHLDRFFADQVDRGELAGIVTLVARHGKVVHLSAIGYADLEKKRPMQIDSIFRLYSMTKPIASVALMTLYEEGRFQLTDPLSKFIPELASLKVLRTPDAALDDTVAPDHAPTIQDALRHTAGFTHGGDGTPLEREYDQQGVFRDDVSLAAMMPKLARIPLHYQPGTRFQYSIGPDVLARVVEVLSGQPFDRYLESHLFTPLHMKDTGYRVAPENAARLATVYWRKDGKLVPLDAAHGHPDGHGPSRGWGDFSHYTNERQQKGGSSGLAGTAVDYWRFAQMLLDGGALDGVRILSPAIVHYMTQDHLGSIPMAPPGERPTGLGFGLGFAVVKDPAEVGYVTSAGTFFWAGAANTHFWIDPKQDLVIVAMVQDVGDAPGGDLAGQLCALVYGALLD